MLSSDLLAIHENVSFLPNPSSDPESFVRGGPIIFQSMRGVRVKIPLSAGHHRLASKTPFKWRFAVVPMMAKCRFGSFIIFRGSGPVLVRNSKAL